MTNICTICARGGSVGLPRKNIRYINGKPLICHTIEQAISSTKIDYVYVSTDCPEIASVAENHGAKILGLRPSELSTSETPKLDVLHYLVNQIESIDQISIDKIVDLDPTSPLRLINDINNCIDLLSVECDVVITGYESDKNPYFNMIEQQEDGSYLPVKPVSQVVARQLAPVVFSMNASIYVWHRRTLSKGLWDGFVKLYKMPRERSIDIDTLLDFQIVEMLMKSSNQSTIS